MGKATHCPEKKTCSHYGNCEGCDIGRRPMKATRCPIRKTCHDYGNCDGCAVGKQVEKDGKKIRELGSKLKDAQSDWATCKEAYDVCTKTIVGMMRTLPLTKVSLPLYLELPNNYYLLAARDEMFASGKDTSTKDPFLGTTQIGGPPVADDMIWFVTTKLDIVCYIRDHCDDPELDPVMEVDKWLAERFTPEDGFCIYMNGCEVDELPFSPNAVICEIRPTKEWPNSFSVCGLPSKSDKRVILEVLGIWALIGWNYGQFMWGDDVHDLREVHKTSQLLQKMFNFPPTEGGKMHEGI